MARFLYNDIPTLFVKTILYQTGTLDGWLADWLAGWLLAGWLDGWLASWLACGPICKALIKTDRERVYFKRLDGLQTDRLGQTGWRSRD